MSSAWISSSRSKGLENDEENALPKEMLNFNFIIPITYFLLTLFRIIIAMFSKFCFGQLGYVIALLYTCISLAFFLMRTLQLQLFAEPVQTQPDMYGMPQSSSYGQTGIKRRRYFLLFVSLSQPFLMWWLSSNIL